jgi:hypothetical protein
VGRRAANAICLHDPTLNELRKKFCFRETKKCDFCIFLFRLTHHADVPTSGNVVRTVLLRAVNEKSQQTTRLFVGNDLMKFLMVTNSGLNLFIIFFLAMRNG